jgi:hypothetical protein
MLSRLRISEEENKIYFEVDKEGLFHVTVRNSDGTLIFERLCWELISNIQYSLMTTGKIKNPEIQINPCIPKIKTSVDYEQNKIYVSCEEGVNIDLNIRAYDTFNNKIVWRTNHKFNQNRVWYSPSRKLASIGNLLLIIKDRHDNVIYTEHINNTQYIFCHIPKTGGTSVKKVLNVRTDHDVFDKNKSNTFSFAFVRNPYKRFLSAYFFLLNGGLGASELRDKEKYLGDDTDIDSFIKNKLHNSLSQIHLKPQHEFIPNGVDYLGKVETMQEDFDKICQLIGFEPIKLPYENKTSKYEYELTQEQKDIIYEVYKEDFIRFGYDR